MSRPPFQTYPSHHPHHGRPYIVVHDHDVLNGRGVNIASHPGNERFRSLINTRQDDSYCTSFTTSEKRALAEEVISHIRKLDPPGRFLKRCGRSQSARGLNGPWEELSHRECVKKTCQALRDCNRQDRQGYADQVKAPTDVRHSANERARTGLSLKEHAAAAVASANPSTRTSQHFNPNPPLVDQIYAAASESTPFEIRKRGADDIASTDDTLSPSVEHAAQALKKPRSVDHSPFAPPAPADPVLSTMSSQVHSTPAPLVAPVPVSRTPPSSQSHPAVNLAHVYHPSDHLTASPTTSSPHLPSPSTYHHHDEQHAPAPYSPVVLLHDDPSADAKLGIDPHHHLDPYPTHHGQQFDPFNAPDPSDPQSTDILHSAAAAAASSLEHHHHHHHQRVNSLTLMHGDEMGLGQL